MSNRYYMPDLLESWRWTHRHLNPHYQEVKEESAAWARSFGAFSPKAQEAYDRCNFSLASALVYPSFDKAHLRASADLMHVYYFYDEYSDVAHEDEVQVMANVIKDALRNPHTPRPKGEWVGGEVTRQFWERAIKTVGPQSQKRFIDAFAIYAQSVVEQAADRNRDHVRTIQEYLEIRIATVGIMPCFAFLGANLNLPDEAVDHPAIAELSNLAVILILLYSDITSYNKEQACGDDDHNIITILMHHNKTDIQGAIDWVHNYHKELEAKFMDIYENKIPKFGEPVDTELAQYVDGIGHWVRGIEQWYFESERYFGKNGPEIKKTRWVTLSPKRPVDEVGPQLVQVDC
ncbi:terpenoid synthase [Russula brevipes]|nr:terpenoid synthase [Russula brevipes]